MYNQVLMRLMDIDWIWMAETLVMNLVEKVNSGSIWQLDVEKVVAVVPSLLRHSISRIFQASAAILATAPLTLEDCISCCLEIQLP